MVAMLLRRPVSIASTDTPDISPRRRRLVEQITLVNRTADTRWLGSFDDDALESYLDHLHASSEPRGRAAVWVRRGETPAIVGSVREDA
ncbi:MAG: hypothetical protein EA379_07010 [Phycisphaerales bacterium]|nr:MAG: hypothetical protein EA379_07010 [Phycisphaerales bacterium]